MLNWMCTYSTDTIAMTTNHTYQNTRTNYTPSPYLCVPLPSVWHPGGSSWHAQLSL